MSDIDIVRAGTTFKHHRKRSWPDETTRTYPHEPTPDCPGCAAETALEHIQQREQYLRDALTILRQWDMLDACHDGPWAKRLIDRALDGRDPRREDA